MSRFIAAIVISAMVMLTAATAQEAGNGEAAAERSDIELLIDVIEDDAARAELIERLRAAGAESETSPPDAMGDTLVEDEAPPQDLSFGRRIALITQSIAEDVAEKTTATWPQLTRSGSVLDGLSGRELGVLWEALVDLALVIAITVGVFLVLRRIGMSIYRRMGASARDGGLARAIPLYLASGLIDALIVVLAWAAGYAITILALGQVGQISIHQTLYLNAFLLVEMAKVVVRLILSPSTGSLRPIPIGDHAARYLNSRLNVVVSLVGYGQLLVVPIINSNVSRTAGNATSTLIAFVVLIILVWLVLRNRKDVTDWMLGPETQDLPPEAEAEAAAPQRRSALAFLARHWHWPALIYLLVPRRAAQPRRRGLPDLRRLGRDTGGCWASRWPGC